MITTKQMKFSPLFFLLALLWSSCKSPSASEVQMPPTPPHDRIQSAIFPANPPEETSAESVEETPMLPTGIRLQFKGKEVSLEQLVHLPSSSLKHKVTVLAHPSTRYGDVAEVMDRLHEMGYMINFQAIE